jgi:hypothetical protein
MSWNISATISTHTSISINICHLDRVFALTARPLQVKGRPRPRTTPLPLPPTDPPPAGELGTHCGRAALRAVGCDLGPICNGRSRSPRRRRGRGLRHLEGKSIRWETKATDEKHKHITKQGTFRQKQETVRQKHGTAFSEQETVGWWLFNWRLVTHGLWLIGFWGFWGLRLVGYANIPYVPLKLDSYRIMTFEMMAHDSWDDEFSNDNSCLLDDDSQEMWNNLYVPLQLSWYRIITFDR